MPGSVEVQTYGGAQIPRGPGCIGSVGRKAATDRCSSSDHGESSSPINAVDHRLESGALGALGDAPVYFLAEALVAVQEKYGLTMYEIAKSIGDLLPSCHFSANYLYRLRSGEKKNPSQEQLSLIVIGIREARGDEAAKFFLMKLYRLEDQDGQGPAPKVEPKVPVGDSPSSVGATA